MLLKIVGTLTFSLERLHILAEVGKKISEKLLHLCANNGLKELLQK